MFLEKDICYFLGKRLNEPLWPFVIVTYFDVNGFAVSLECFEDGEDVFVAKQFVLR